MDFPPRSSTVLIAGGGPGGSYTAAVLAREGIDVVLLEADRHPRYHVGESLLPSMRAFLDFIGLEEEYEKHGFRPKRGATFKLTAKREAYSDFTEVNGPSGRTWNCVRSESDEILFRHAANCGAKTFEDISLEAVKFASAGPGGSQFTSDEKLANPGRPTTALWTSKDGKSGTIEFDYLVDATGRNGILSTRYLKNRKFNAGLKNLAIWGYYEGAQTLSPGTKREGQPFFEGMHDGAGWVWCIPLHNGTLSVGAVVRQDLFQDKKRNLGMDATPEQMLKECVKQCPTVRDIVEPAKLVSDIKQASDFSYSASAYAGPYFRLVGDAGAFIDPFFSSGNHLALSSGLGAAVSIVASIRGDCSELEAARYHSKKVAERYTAFLLVVLAATKQIRHQEEPMLGDINRDDFDAAFEMFKPIIQGGSDSSISKGFTQAQISQTIDFCFQALNAWGDDSIGDHVVRMSKEGGSIDALAQEISEQDLKALKGFLIWGKVIPGGRLDNFEAVPVGGLVPRLQRGYLGLLRTEMKQENGVVVT